MWDGDIGVTFGRTELGTQMTPARHWRNCMLPHKVHAVHIQDQKLDGRHHNRFDKLYTVLLYPCLSVLVLLLLISLSCSLSLSLSVCVCIYISASLLFCGLRASLVVRCSAAVLLVGAKGILHAGARIAQTSNYTVADAEDSTGNARYRRFGSFVESTADGCSS